MIEKSLKDKIEEGFKEKLSRNVGKITGFLGILTALSPLALKSYTINGNVKDVHENNNKANVEVVVKDVNDPSKVDTAYTDTNGNFSLEWSFNQAPIIYNVSPEDGATGVSLNPELKVIGEDPDNDSLDVGFYKASNDSLIGTDNIQSGDTASVVWDNLANSTLYDWYVKANDGEDTTTSSVWDFTTESNGGITEKEAENIRIYGEGSDLKVNKSIDKTLEGKVFNSAGIEVGELTKTGSEYGFSVSGVPQGNYFMILESDGEMIAQIKFQNLNNNVSSVSPKWNIEEDNVSSSDLYEMETNYSSEKANSSSLRSSNLDSLEFTLKNDSDIWERVTYKTANPDETNNYDFSVIDKSIFDSTMMDFYNEITARLSHEGTGRWASGKTIQYMVDTTDMSQTMINNIVSIINDEVIYMTNNEITPVINFTNTHPDHYYGADTINIHIDNDIPGRGAHSEKSIEGYDDNNYTLEVGYVKLKSTAGRGTILQEILQNKGWVCDSDMENSVFNDGTIYDYLQKADSLSRILYMRPPRTQDPDKDPEEGYFDTSMNSSNPENIEFCYNNSGFYQTKKEKEMFFNYGGETIKVKEDEITKVKLNDLIKK